MADDVLKIVLYPPWWTPFGKCYECKDGLHDLCVSVPCECECENG